MAAVMTNLQVSQDKVQLLINCLIKASPLVL